MHHTHGNEITYAKEMHTHTCILYIYAHGYSSWYNYNSYAYAHNTQYTSIQNTQYTPTHTHPWYAYGRMDFLLHSKQLVDKNAKCELVRIKEEEHTTSQLVQTTLAMVKNCKPYQTWRLTSATFDKPVTSLGWYPAHHPFLVPTGCNAPGADVIDICVEAWTEIWGTTHDIPRKPIAPRIATTPASGLFVFSSFFQNSALSLLCMTHCTCTMIRTSYIHRETHVGCGRTLHGTTWFGMRTLHPLPSECIYPPLHTFPSNVGTGGSRWSNPATECHGKRCQEGLYIIIFDWMRHGGDLLCTST